jgi:hypothetical protein
MYTLVPDSILFGSLFLAVLTQNLAYGIFGLFVFETILIHKSISWGFLNIYGPSSSGEVDESKMHCRAGFKTPRYEVSRIFAHNPYPSYGIFSMVSIVTYLSFCMNEVSNVLNTMGKEWNGRILVANILSTLMLLIYISVRMLNGCESIEEILLAITSAIISGIALFYINKSIFGTEAVNILGLPMMESKVPLCKNK